MKQILETERLILREMTTESAGACIRLGFEKFGMKTIVGRAMKKNLASIRVLEKTGLLFYGTFDFDREEGVVLAISNNLMEK